MLETGVVVKLVLSAVALGCVGVTGFYLYHYLRSAGEVKPPAWLAPFMAGLASLAGLLWFVLGQQKNKPDEPVHPTVPGRDDDHVEAIAEDDHATTTERIDAHHDEVVEEWTDDRVAAEGAALFDPGMERRRSLTVSADEARAMMRPITINTPVGTRVVHFPLSPLTGGSICTGVLTKNDEDGCAVRRDDRLEDLDVPEEELFYENGRSNT